jgi:hypothetical protein
VASDYVSSEICSRSALSVNRTMNPEGGGGTHRRGGDGRGWHVNGQRALGVAGDGALRTGMGHPLGIGGRGTHSVDSVWAAAGLVSRAASTAARSFSAGSEAAPCIPAKAAKASAGAAWAAAWDSLAGAVPSVAWSTSISWSTRAVVAASTWAYMTAPTGAMCDGVPGTDNDVPSTSGAHAGAGLSGSAKVTHGTRSVTTCSWAATAATRFKTTGMAFSVFVLHVVYDVQAVW